MNSAISIVVFLIFLVIIGVIIYLVYDYMDYKNNVDKSFGMTTINLNDGFKKTAHNLEVTKQNIEDDIDKTNLDVKGVQIQNEAIATHINNIDTDLNNFDSSLKKYFTFYDNNTAIQNDKLFNHVFSGINPDLELMAKVNSTNGITITTPENTIDDHNLKICNDLRQCIHLNVNNNGFNITPDNVSGLTINSKSGPALAKFDMDNNGVYLGGADTSAPLFIQDGNLFINNINMVVRSDNDNNDAKVLRVTGSDIIALRNWSSNVVQELQEQSMITNQYIMPALQFAKNEYTDYNSMKNNYLNLSQSLQLIVSSNNIDLGPGLNNLKNIRDKLPEIESRVNYLDSNYSNINSHFRNIPTDGTYLDLINKVNLLDGIKNNYPDLANRVGGLETSKSSLMSDMSSINNKYDTLNSSMTFLNNNYNRIDTNMSNFANNYNNKDSKITEFDTRLNNIDTKVSNLSSNIPELKDFSSIPDLVANISKLMQYVNDVPVFFNVVNNSKEDTIVLKLMNRQNVKIGDKFKIRLFNSDIGSLTTSDKSRIGEKSISNKLITIGNTEKKNSRSKKRGEYYIQPTRPFTIGEGSTLSYDNNICELVIVSGVNIPAYSSIEVSIIGYMMLEGKDRDKEDNNGFVIGKHNSS